MIRRKRFDHSIIDMSLEANFGIRERRRPLIPIGRPNDIISAIASVVSVVIGAVTGTSAGIVTGVVVGGVLISSQAIAAAIVIGAIIGLTVWSMTSGGKKGGGGGVESALEQNGQIVNTRQASKPLFVVYGICRVGGNWVFSRPSSNNNNILNTVITWSEGEIEGLGMAIDYTPLYSGSALNDIHTGGDYVSPGCVCNGSCYLEVGCVTCDMAVY